MDPSEFRNWYGDLHHFSRMSMLMEEPQNLRAERNLNERAFRGAVAGATAFNTDPTDFRQ